MVKFKELAEKAAKGFKDTIEADKRKGVYIAHQEQTIKDLEDTIESLDGEIAELGPIERVKEPTPKEILNLKPDYDAGIVEAMACFRLLTGKTIRAFKGKSNKESILEAVIFAAINARDIEKLRKIKIKKKYPGPK